MKRTTGDFPMRKKHSEPTAQEFTEAVKFTALKRRETPVKYENREPTKKELNKRFTLNRRRGEPALC